VREYLNLCFTLLAASL